MATKPIPEGTNTVLPHLSLSDCAKAVEFYKKVFNAEERNRAPGPGGKVMHTELKIGDSLVYASDEFGPHTVPAGVTVHVWSADPDGVFERAVKNGAQVKLALENQFWGDRYGQFTDPWGHTWAVSKHIEDLTPDEMMKRAQAAFASMK
jgi:PhnB protein